MSVQGVEVAAEYADAPIATSSDHAQDLASLSLDSKVSSFVLPGTVYETIASSGDIGQTIFGQALGGAVVRSSVRYSFDGHRTRGAHVDEVPEDLLGLRHFGMFNVHHVLKGAIRAMTVFTAPGYYCQDKCSRVPLARYNPGITDDLLRGTVNTYTSSSVVTTSHLSAGDRLVFFERTSETIDGAPNVLHLFYGGTADRYSLVDRYYSTD